VVAVAVVLVFTAFLKNLPGQDMTQAELVRDITVKDITLGLQLGAQVE
jgi:hypothetical protein